MRSLLAAFGFLTILPVGIKLHGDKEFSQALIYFPVVGLVLGLILAVAYKCAFFLGLNPFLSAIVVVALLIILSRAIHLDGLADTADALLSSKTREEMLVIMRDPHIGTMGVVSIILVLLLKVGIIYSLPFTKVFASLIIMCVISRFSQVFVLQFFKYVRVQGKARIFADNINLRIFLLSGLLALLATYLFMGIWGLILMTIVLLLAAILCNTAQMILGGITGDVIGAVSELTEVIFLAGCLLK